MEKKLVGEVFADIKRKDENIINGELLDIADGTSLKEFENIIINHFLGREYYIVDPVSSDVGRTVILKNILDKYPKPNKDIYYDAISDKIKKFFCYNSSLLDEHVKDLYDAILKNEGFKVIYFANEENLKTVFHYFEPNCIKIEIDNRLLIVAPLYQKSYKASCESDNLRLADCFILNSNEVTGVHIKGLIKSLNSIF